MTIRTRLALWYSGLLALLIISFGVAVITISRLTLLQTLDSILAGQAQNLASIIDTAPLEASSTVFTYRDEQAFRSPGILIQIWRTHENGSPIDPVLERHSGLADDVNTPLDASLFNKNAISFNSTVISGVPERVVALPIYTEEGLPIGLIQIATPLRDSGQHWFRHVVIQAFAETCRSRERSCHANFQNPRPFDPYAIVRRSR
jgi:hypothetical protein